VDVIYDMAVQPDGRIIVAGAAADTFALARYHTDSSLDVSFGRTGYVTTTITISHTQSAAYTLLLQSNGDILAGGMLRTFALPYSVITRYHPEGSLDTTFGNAGFINGFGSGYLTSSNVAALALLPDNKILAAVNWASVFGPAKTGGYSTGSIVVAGSSDGRFVLARYANYPSASIFLPQLLNP
jgi:uncharacterized delta-60 repeat protein